jgi:hypothetical protein
MVLNAQKEYGYEQGHGHGQDIIGLGWTADNFVIRNSEGSAEELAEVSES